MTDGDRSAGVIERSAEGLALASVGVMVGAILPSAGIPLSYIVFSAFVLSGIGLIVYFVEVENRSVYTGDDR